MAPSAIWRLRASSSAGEMSACLSVMASALRASTWSSRLSASTTVPSRYFILPSGR